MANENMFKWLVVLSGLVIAYVSLFNGNITPLPNVIDTLLGAAIGVMSLFIGYKLVK